MCEGTSSLVRAEHLRLIKLMHSYICDTLHRPCQLDIEPSLNQLQVCGIISFGGQLLEIHCKGLLEVVQGLEIHFLLELTPQCL
jgi:hypothetical protein